MSKRSVAAAGFAAAVFAFAAAAWAQGATKTFTDTQNRFSFSYPASLPVETTANPNQPVNILVGAADYECKMFIIERPENASASPDAVVRAYSNVIAADAWKRTADGFNIDRKQATVQATSVDTSKFWPVQRADMRTSGGRPLLAALHARGGFEVWQFCTDYDNRDHAAVFNQIITSFSTPNDAALQSQAEANVAAREAQKAAADAAAAAAAAAQPKEKKQKKKRGER